MPGKTGVGYRLPMLDGPGIVNSWLHRQNDKVFSQAHIMNITDVRIKKVDGNTSTKAMVSVTIDDALVVHDIRVIEGKNGLFVSMPSKKVGDKYVNISHPVTADSRTVLIDAVLNKYHRQA